MIPTQYRSEPKAATDRLPAQAGSSAPGAAGSAEKAPGGAVPGVGEPIGGSPPVSWACESRQLDASGNAGEALAEPLTVGQKFVLRCEGSPISGLNREKLRLELPKEHQFALRILEVKSIGETGGEFVAVTWVASEGRLEPVLTDGNARVSLGQVELKARSVITPETNPENKPFPPWGSAILPWPVYMWVVVGVLLALLVGSILLAVRKTLARRRLLKLLKDNAPALTPYHQFNKELRKIVRQIPGGPTPWTPDEAQKHFTELDQSIRWFLARELVIPAIDSRPKRVVREVEKVAPNLFKEIRKDLLLALTELEKAISNAKAAKAEDAHQLTELCRRLADRIGKPRSA